MPRISEFYGILIYMYFGEHGAPHFHAIYGEHDAASAFEAYESWMGGCRRGRSGSCDSGPDNGGRTSR